MCRCTAGRLAAGVKHLGVQGGFLEVWHAYSPERLCEHLRHGLGHMPSLAQPCELVRLQSILQMYPIASTNMKQSADMNGKQWRQKRYLAVTSAMRAS